MELYMWPCLDSFINAMISRSFPVLAPVRIPFLPMDEWFIMCRHLFIHSFIQQQTFGRVPIWLLLRLSTETVDTFLFEYTFSILWGIHLAVEFLGQIVILWLTCGKAAWLTLWPPCYLPWALGGCTASGSPHWNLFSFCLVVESWQVLVRMWRKWKASTPSVTNIGIATMKHWREVPPKAKNRTIIWIKPPTS